MDDLTMLLARSADLVKASPKGAKAIFKATLDLHCPHCGVKHRTITPEQCIDRRMSERTLQDRVVDRAKRRGWKVAHAGKGIAAFDKAGAPVFVTPMSKGWPDLFMAHEGMGRVMAIELKREEGEVEPEQLQWLQLLNVCGIPAVVIRPSDLRLGRVNAILGPQ